MVWATLDPQSTQIELTRCARKSVAAAAGASFQTRPVIQAQHQTQCQSQQQIRYQPAAPINRNTKQSRHRTLTVLVTHNTIHETTIEV